ncbi:hypothetical protein QN382_12510 [Pseudomonas sp. 10B1]|uniref:hypothetical protein n=1 Tax=unclassified Pseudomonas TaxID=196821 RepID=UPI002B23C9DA|nr:MULTISPECIES: hypothetical protein [unclassified Pseudomonas]MEA9996307.1 hypothetical protein [Pseudomonas sp. AA4]MEB0086651.1 hypothetical protein [Pseudomonas sp. RTI1]MEB0124701.1 hypothetical protein [Pseudomonas sp. CCC1.2]MEB0154965.1 hypothetical protein [Pseudomonas sp. CCC4.3]MEB0217926.1 hypothetical protein [Pseudomonas sp. AB12(2023)]
MKIQNGASTPTLPARPKKAIELFFVTHPKAPKALLGPFLSKADAECGLVVMRSAEAVVTSSLVDGIDEFTRWTGINNGAICRAFAGNGVHHD